MNAPGADLRAAGLLRTWVRERGPGTRDVAARAGLEAPELEAMLEGRELLPLKVIEQVLEALQVEPAEFFGRLYGEEAHAETGVEAQKATAALSDDRPMSRREVEGIGREMRQTLDRARRSLATQDLPEPG